jgi:hypothetical protein
MIKNVIIGLLALFSIFFFLYALTQQIKAEQLNVLLLKSEREALQQREAMETALEESRRQTELVRLELKRSGQAQD